MCAVSISHPDRAGFGLLLSTCAASSKSPKGFANQPDEVLHAIGLRLLYLITDWRDQIEEDSSLRNDFHRFIEEFSAIGLYEQFATRDLLGILTHPIFPIATAP